MQGHELAISYLLSMALHERQLVAVVKHVLQVGWQAWQVGVGGLENRS
jgi:hypothetical protein